MPYIQPDVVQRLKNIDLLTYLQIVEPDNLVKISANVYCTKEHDSLKISNGKWMWWSQSVGGYNALDYLTKVKGYSFYEAINQLAENDLTTCSVAKSANEVRHIPKQLLLPEFNDTNDRVIEYLTNQRGIDIDVINYCIDKGIIKESLPYHNVIFIGIDEKKIPRYASFRSTNSKRILGDCLGSDKTYSFRICDVNDNAIHLFESAIDLLSYATLIKHKGLDFTEYSLISLAGVYQPKENIYESKVPITLSNYLKKHSNTNKIILHFDNDRAGRLATETFKVILPKDIEVVDSPPVYGKDVNDYLCHIKGISRNMNEDIERS